MPTSSTSGRILGVLSLGLLVACPGGEEAPDAGPEEIAQVHGRPGEAPLEVPDSVPLDQLCAYLSESKCDFIARCDPTAPFLRVESCRADENIGTARCLGEIQYPIEKRVLAGTVEYRGDRVTECLRALDMEKCLGVDDLPECDPLRFTEGLQPRSGCCFDTSECRDGVCRDRGGGGTDRGRCGASLSVGASPCFSNPDCESGSTCVRGTCAAQSGEGQGCGPFKADCQEGLHCAGETGSETCQLPAQRGARCGYDDTEFPPCERALACRPVEGRDFGICGDYLQEGESCDEGTIACSPGLRCTSPRGGGRYECTYMSFGGAGEGCENGTGTTRCDSRTWCETQRGETDGQCAAFPGIGEACDGLRDCRNGWCRPSSCSDPGRLCRLGSAGTCEPYLGIEVTCVDSRQCGPIMGGKICKTPAQGGAKVCAVEQAVQVCE